LALALNTNIEKIPRDLENIATSIKIELKKEVDNKELLEKNFGGTKREIRNYQLKWKKKLKN
jgi:hypothetical protein